MKMETEKKKCSDKTCNKVTIILLYYFYFNMSYLERHCYQCCATKVCWLLNIRNYFVYVSRSGSLSSASCSGRCGQSPDSSAQCQCHAWCKGSNSCCPDYASICKSGTPVTFPSEPMKPMVDPFQGMFYLL